MTRTSVRPAAAVDLAAVCAVDELAVPGSGREAELRSYVSGDSGWCLVAEDVDDTSTRVVGYVAVMPQHFFGRDLVVLLVVTAARRRSGVGSMLLAAATARASTDSLFTSTNESNVAMLSLLHREGWVVSGTLTGLDEGDDEVVLHRPSGRAPGPAVG